MHQHSHTLGTLVTSGKLFLISLYTCHFLLKKPKILNSAMNWPQKFRNLCRKKSIKKLKNGVRATFSSVDSSVLKNQIDFRIRIRENTQLLKGGGEMIAAWRLFRALCLDRLLPFLNLLFELENMVIFLLDNFFFSHGYLVLALLRKASNSTLSTRNSLPILYALRRPDFMYR